MPQKLMNKTIISILIWLVCMPCMAASETPEELEAAIEKCKKEVSALFDTNETEAFTNATRKLMDLCQKEPGLTPYQQMNTLAYKCEAAFCGEPVDSAFFMTNYTELKRMMKESGRTSVFYLSQDIHYFGLTGQYDKMLELARQKPTNMQKYECIVEAYKNMGRWKEAFDTLNLYVMARDSARTDETRKQIENR